MTRVMHIDETVTIGGDLTVGRIGYGAMQLTGPKVWANIPTMARASRCCERLSPRA